MVDANVLLSVALGRRSRPLFDAVIVRRRVLTSAGAAHEVRRVLSDPRLPARAGPVADALLGQIEVVPELIYGDALGPAARVLSHAVPSLDGSGRDAHLLACAWTLDADLWTHDRDFAGTGWPSWSSSNLIAALT